MVCMDNFLEILIEVVFDPLDGLLHVVLDGAVALLFELSFKEVVVEAYQDRFRADSSNSGHFSIDR